MLKIQTKPDEPKKTKTLKQIRNNLIKAGLENIGLQELIDIGLDEIPEPTITNPKDHYLLSRDSKLNYFKYDDLGAVVNYNGVYFGGDLQYYLNKTDEPDAKGNNGITAFKRLQDILQQVITEYEKEFLHYNHIQAIATELFDLFEIFDEPELQAIDTIDLLKYVANNIAFSLYITYKETQENIFNYYIELSCSCQLSEPPDFIPAGFTESCMPFNSYKHYTNFKNKLKKIYNKLQILYKQLLTDNANAPKEKALYLKTVTNPKLKLLTYFTNQIEPFKTDKRYLYYKNDNGDILRTPKNIKFTIFDASNIIYFLTNYDEKTNSTRFSVNEYFLLSKQKNKKDFKRQVNSSCEKSTETSFTFMDAGNSKQYGINIIDNYNIDNDNGVILYTQGFKESLKAQHKHLMKMEIPKAFFGIDNRKPNRKTIAFYLIEKFTYKHGKKYQHIKKQVVNGSNKYFNYVSVKELLKHTTYLSKNKTRNKFSEIIELLEKDLDALIDENKIISEWFYTKRDLTAPNLLETTAKEKFNFYIKYSMEKPE